MVVTTTGFSALARFTAKARGVANLRIAEYPGPLGIHDASRIEANVQASLMAAIVAGLTGGDFPSDSASIIERSHQADTVLSGSPDAIQHFFATKDWTDGLPIIPPTRERVEAFMQFTARGADEVVAVLPSANLVATPWNIAVNAVMAGCHPEHMPILLAAVEALGDERCALGSLGSTSGIFPYMLINGPVVEQLGIEYGAQLVSRGPNPALGRALGLIVKNIAGFRAGASYMGTFGYALPFALAESAKATLWEPFHVQQGFDLDVSTVTVGVTNNWAGSPAAYHTAPCQKKLSCEIS